MDWEFTLISKVFNAIPILRKSHRNVFISVSYLDEPTFHTNDGIKSYFIFAILIEFIIAFNDLKVII